MAGESITFDFVGRGADTLQRDFKGVGDNAALAAKGARLCADALAAQRKAADTSAGATLALAKADKILADAEDELAGRAALADEALRNQADAAKKAAAESAAAGAAADSAGGGFSALASPMGAAVVAGIALSPVLVTLGAGLGGLGLAALSVAKNQQLMTAELAPLKTELAAFSKSLQPEVLAAFSGGIQIAGHLLHDLQPVAAATGNAFAGFLGQLDKTFASGQFQQFFKFMAATAAPDMQLLGAAFISVIKILPGLLETLQPVAVQLIGLTTDFANLTAAVINFGQQNDAVSKSTGTNTGVLGFLAKAVSNVSSFMKPGGVLAGAFASAMGEIPPTAGAAGAAMGGAAVHAQTLAQQLAAVRAEVTKLTTAEAAALSPLLAYTNALIAQHSDAGTLAKALTASSGSIGLQTAAQRASFSAANTYIQDLLTTASAADKSHQGINAQITSLQNALPALENVKGGTTQYWQEVRTLVSWLQKLQQIKTISEKVNITGSGSWAFVQGAGANARLTSGTPAARGMYVASGRPGVDDQLIRAQRGELVVPTPIVASGAVDHLRGAIPGFATGGIVGSYSGGVGGLQPWGQANWQATVTQISTDVAKAMAAQVKAAASAAQSGAPGAQGGPASASAGQAQSYARSRLGAYGWAATQMSPLISLWNQESGWNRLARNPSSGAYGIPQALPASKMGAAANPPTSSAAAQINWGLGYIKSTYGTPGGAEAHELAHHWYDQGGLLLPGLTLAANGTGKPEHVIPGEGIAGMIAQLTQILAALQQLTSVVSGGSGGSIAGGSVGNFTGVVSPAGGGFGLTRTDLGLPPPAAASTADTSSTDTSSTDTSTTTAAAAAPKKAAGPNPAQKSAIAALEHMMGGLIRGNKLGEARQAGALLDWLGVSKYNSQISQIGRLDNLLLSYRKHKNTAAAKATETLLGTLGVHSFSPVMTAKGNTPKATATAALTALIHQNIAANNLTGARQSNALLTHLGVGKFSGDLSQIAYLDGLLARYKKAKNAKDIKATETLLRQYGVKKFASGGWITEPVTGIGASGQVYQFGEAGRPELVVPASGRGGSTAGSDLGGRLDRLIALHEQLIRVTASAPAATGRHVAGAVNGAAADAVFRGRYPGR